MNKTKNNGLNRLGIMEKWLCRPAVPMEEEPVIHEFAARLIQEGI